MLHAAYARAAHLLREAIEIDGVAFYNASVGFHPRVDVGEPEQSPVLNADEGANHTPSSSGQAARTFTSSTFHIVSNQGVKAHKRAQVLGWAMSHEPDQTRGGTFPRDPPPIEEDVLQYLFRRYPRGKLWAVDGDRILSGSDDEEIRVVPDSKARGRNRESQFSRLLTCFPGAKSILFAPLCDASSSVWIGGCFAWIKGDAPILTAEIDLAYLRAFMNSVSAEVSRVKALAVDRQTTSFISSISHELRSPLHGILGAVNFLSDTSLDSFQRGLVDSVHACGSTLHETLTSVLAYAKVNNLKQKQTRLGRHHPPATISENSATGQTDELHSLYAPTNLAVLCEEIVEMVEGAHFYSHDILHATPASTHDEPRPRSSKVTIEGVAGAPIETEGPRLLVVLNTEFRENWNFITQPGALRRIMMNIVGNALKYSQRGSIQVKLQAEDGGVDGPRSSLAPGDDDDDLSVSPVVVVFTVEDTGRGISREFLQTRLFSPFAQENAVSSTGVGLGLSIVKDLVRLLGGQIDVKSQEGRGTQVKVSIPMTRTTSATPGPMATHTMLERAVPELRQRRLAVQVHAFPPLVVTSLTTYLVDWFQSDLIPMESPSTPDLVVVNETESESYFAAEALKTVDRTPPAVLIVSMDNARWSTGRIASPPLRIVERMSYPFGAVKMAKAVLNCIHRMNLVCGAVGTASASDDRVSPLAWSVRDAQLAKEGLAIEVARKAASRAGRRSEADGYPFPDSRGLPRIISISRPSNHHLPARSSPHPALDSNVNIPSGKGRREPRILLVDDNTINLRLLQTFMKKRKYRHVDSAEDGQQAVDAVKERTEGYDIIFMDVSMPVMDGLSATRAIRGLERERREKQMQHTRATSAPTPTPSPSLIVALTGLASSHDQSEAFSSGMDLFLTKPVKFAKLGEILGEWETGGVGGVVSGGKGGGLSTGLE
ncbi:MAG: hypothetical protein M1838_004825 [Thelocarpon superellum]|nr:MAG: hypothetical protein M1838_004825 [Thelocarpon superellum]